MPKEKLKPDHAEWLVESRRRNQLSSAQLYRLLRDYPELTTNTKGRIRYDAQTLVAIAFSLWRALFLSGRSPSGTETAQHAELFLAEILENNAINFAQDRNSMNWTFNYYMGNARYRLNEYADDHTGIQRMPESMQRGSKAKAKSRWNAFQNAFEKAVDHFESRLKKAAGDSK